MKAFLSHSSADKPLASTIFRALRDQAVSVWFDRIDMRPGDSLRTKIAEGIGEAAFLLVLVTENSKRSPWVEEELAMANELQGIGPKVIPLLLSGCQLPEVLADKYYLTIDDHGGGIEDVIPAMFRNSYILDVPLRREDLTCDEHALRSELYEYTRSAYADVRVRLDNRGFNRKAIELAANLVSASDTPRAVASQIKRISESFHLELPIYWVNLSALLGQLATAIIAHYGKTLDAVNASVTTMMRSLTFAQAVMCDHINGAVFSISAEQFGYADIAAYLRKFEQTDLHDEALLARQICDIDANRELVEVGLVGNEERRVASARLYLPHNSADETGRLMIRMSCDPQHLITFGQWFSVCLPQILGQFLQWSAFRDGKPPHELDYTIGLAMADYDRLGLPD